MCPAKGRKGRKPVDNVAADWGIDAGPTQLVPSAGTVTTAWGIGTGSCSYSCRDICRCRSSGMRLQRNSFTAYSASQRGPSRTLTSCQQPGRFRGCVSARCSQKCDVVFARFLRFHLPAPGRTGHDGQAATDRPSRRRCAAAASPSQRPTRERIRGRGRGGRAAARPVFKNGNRSGRRRRCDGPWPRIAAAAMPSTRVAGLRRTPGCPTCPAHS